MTEPVDGRKIMSKLIGETIKAVYVREGSYGLIDCISITTENDETFHIDGQGTDGGECGLYPGMNIEKVIK